MTPHEVEYEELITVDSKSTLPMTADILLKIKLQPGQRFEGRVLERDEFVIIGTDDRLSQSNEKEEAPPEGEASSISTS